MDSVMEDYCTAAPLWLPVGGIIILNLHPQCYAFTTELNHTLRPPTSDLKGHTLLPALSIGEFSETEHTADLALS